VEFQFSSEDNVFRQKLLGFIQEERSPSWDWGDRGSDGCSWELTKEMRRKLADRG
jgi:hypothetical protein